MSFSPPNLGRKKPLPQPSPSRMRSPQKHVNPEMGRRSHGDVINPERSYIPLPTDHREGGRAVPAPPDAALQSAGSSSSAGRASREICDLRRVRRPVSQRVATHVAPGCVEAISVPVWKNQSQVVLQGDSHDEEALRRRRGNPYHDRVVQEGFPLRSPNPVKCRRQYPGLAGSASTPGNKENPAQPKVRRQKHQVPEPPPREEVKTSLRMTDRSAIDRRWGSTEALPAPQQPPRPRRKSSVPPPARPNLCPGPTFPTEPALSPQHHGRLHVDSDIQLPSAEPPDIVPQPPTPPEGLSMLQAVLRHTRKSRFARRGRSASPITGLAVTPERAWQVPPSRGTYAAESFQSTSHLAHSQATDNADALRQVLSPAAGKPIERRLSAPSSYGLRCKSPTMARRAAAGDRAPPWDAEGAAHFGRRVAQHSPALARTDPITHFTPLWTEPYRVDRSSGGLAMQSPSRKRRVPSCTDALSTSLGGPGRRPSLSGLLPPSPSTPNLATDSVTLHAAATYTAATYTAPAPKEVLSTRLSRSGTLPDSLANALSTPPAYRYGRRMPSPPARGVSIVSWT